MPTETNSLVSRPVRKVESAGPRRIGALLKPGKLPQWIAALLVELYQSVGIELILIRIGDVKGKRKGSAGGKLLFELWKSLDARIFSGRNDAFYFVNLPDELSRVYTLETKSPDSSGLLEGKDLEEIRAARLDVILSLDHDELIADLRGMATQGVWSFSRNAEIDRRLFWDIYQGRNTSSIELVRHQSHGSEVLDRCSIAPDPWSIARQRNRTYWCRAGLVKRALVDLFQSRLRSATPLQPVLTSQCDRPKPYAPSNYRVISFLGRQLVSGVVRNLRRAFQREQWFIAVRRRQAADPFRLQNFRLLTPPPDRFFADPFVFERAGRNYLFFEELVFIGGKGVISCIEFNDSGFVGEPKVVLEANYHLSYPFVFEWEGHTYMLPEARESGRIALFRAVDFPFHWQLDRVLIDGVRAVDPTLVQHAGRFWLFAGGVEKHGLIDSDLFLYFSDTPLGPWTPHPKNPIVSDVSRARPAGQIFSHQGRLIRPGQDCSQRYGRAVVLNRIEKLSLTEYRETPLLTLEPDWQPGNLGTHTLNMSENYQVWDGRSYLSKFRAPGKAALSLAWKSCVHPLYLRRS